MDSVSCGSLTMFYSHIIFLFLMSSVKLQEIQIFMDHLVVYERVDGLLNAVTYALPPVGDDLVTLPTGNRIKFSEAAYMIEPMESNFFSPILRYGYSSLRTPLSVYDYDMNTGESALKKIEPVSFSFMYSLLLCSHLYKWDCIWNDTLFIQKACIYA